MVNGKLASLGQNINEADTVTLNDRTLVLEKHQYLVLNKPPGYVSSRRTQGKSPTIYELLPKKYHRLKPVGRLDKDSRGLLLLTNDGALAQELTHPSNQKTKTYHVKLDQPLASKDKRAIENGVEIEGKFISHLKLTEIGNWKLETGNYSWRIVMKEGRNRQIRRTFLALGYEVVDLLRTRFGKYTLEGLPEGQYRETTIT